MSSFQSVATCPEGKQAAARFTLSMSSHTPTPIVWLHGGNLNPAGPALAAHPAAPAVWVWDEALLARQRISLKRILFLYESLLELPVIVRRGDVAVELARFADEHGATTIATAENPGPRFKAVCHQLRERGYTLELHPERPFLAPHARPDLKRFSRYWRVARRYACMETDR